MSARRLRLAVTSSLDNVALVGTAVRGVLRSEWGVQQGAARASVLVELAVCEAVTNAIIHSYRRRPGQPVEVDLEVRPDRLRIHVQDQGAGFGRFPDPLPGIPDIRDLDDLPADDWGLRIIGAVMDEVRYRRRGGSNRLTLILRRGAGGCPTTVAKAAALP